MKFPNDFRKFAEKNYNPLLLLIFFIASLELLLLSLNPLINIDSGWTAEASYNLAFAGRLATPSWGGFLQLEEYFFWRPPLFFLVEALFFRIAGFGALQVSLLISLIILATLAFVIWFAKKEEGAEGAIIAGIVLLSNFMYLLHSVFHGRPDPLVALFNIISAYFLFEYSKGKKTRNLLLSTAAASLSFLSHELGLLMLASIGVNLLLIHRKRLSDAFSAMIKTAAAFLIIISPWLLYLSQNLEVAGRQMGWLLGRHGPLLQVLKDEWIRYEWVFSTNNGAMVPWFLLMLLIVISFLKRKDFGVIPVTILTHLVLFALVGNKATYYFISIVPLVAVQAAKEYRELRKAKSGSLALSVIALVLVSNFALATIFAASISPKYDSMLVQDYLGKRNYGKVVAQPAFYYAFRDSMYSTYAIFNRMGRGETLQSVLEQVGARIIIYDPINLDASSPPEFKQLLAEKATLKEMLCARNHKLLRGQECQSDAYRVEVYQLDKS